MRAFRYLLLTLALGVAFTGCARKTFDGPTVKAFTGKLTQGGKPVTFPADGKAEMKVFHEKGESFGIPLQPDGSFKIGWMPVGKFAVMLVRQPSAGGKKGAPTTYTVPGGLTIEDGKTEYTIELGQGYKS